VTDPRLRRIIDQGLTVLDDGPLTLNCGWDRSCNLHCRTCRHQPFALHGEDAQRVEAFQGRLLDALGPGLRTLFASGTGDPFASSVYRELLRGLPARRLPGLEVHLHTNAQLWTPESWEALGGAQHKVRTAHISVDAASAATYALNRRGGDWERLLCNLAFVADLRREGALRFVTLSFVVQANNVHEMPAFVALVEQHGFDLACFHKLCNWGTFTDAQYRARAVHEPRHPDHAQLLRLLAGETFARPAAGLFCLRPLRERALALRPGQRWVLGAAGVMRRARRRLFPGGAEVRA
jgi:MoaA/NifB/PqqE/SkfB family radical SAM enzyme